MKKAMSWMGLISMALVVMCLIGCETSDNPDTDNVETYFEDNPVSPSSHGDLPAEALFVTASPSSLSSDGAKAVLTVANGTPPYSWAVQDINLGNINTSTGQEVVYTRLNAGDNAVTVSDSRGAYGNVVLTQ